MTPDNAGYAWAAYAIVLLLYGGYSVSIWVRRRRARAHQGDA